MLGGAISVEAKGTPQPDLKKEIAALSKQLEATKADLSALRTDLATLRKEVQTIKNPKSTSSECLARIEEQQRGLADSKELEHVLIKYGNNPDPDCMSALHYAIKMGDINTVNLLIANGADVNSVSMASRPYNAPFTALTRAASCNQFEIAKLLLDLGADVNLVPYDDCKYPLYYAAEKGSSDLIMLLLENGARLDKTRPCENSQNCTPPLHIAAKAGNYEAVVAMVKAGAKLDYALDEAANKLTYKDNPQNLELIKFLVQNGATRGNPSYQYLPCPVISGYLQSIGR